MAWPWVAAQLSGMVAGEFKQLNTNLLSDVALARTRANFDAGSYFTDDADVLANIKAATQATFAAFSGHAINGDTGAIIGRGGGHTDGGDGSIFRFNTSTLAWELSVKSPRYESTNPTVSCNITAIVPGTPPRLTVDADIAISGDQGVITGTTDADGTYQLVRIDATHVDLYNIDGSASGQFTAFAGGALTNSTGTLTITWNPQSANTDDSFAQTNADGEQAAVCTHTYHSDRWIGGNRYALGGTGVFAANSGFTNRLWFYDEDATPKVVRGYHDNRTGDGLYLTNQGFNGRNNGDMAYNPWDGHLYTGDKTVTIFEWRLYRWSPDYLFKEHIGGGGGDAFASNSEGLVLPQPDDPTKRMFFSITSSSAFTAVTDIEAGGTPLQDAHTFVNPLFDTGGVYDVMGRCWDDTNGTIVYWGGGSTIGEIVVNANLDLWDSQEVTPATPTGDVPTSTGATHMCSIAKVPDHDAYLLVQGGNVYLYARSDIVGGGVEGVLAETLGDMTVSSLGSMSVQGNLQETLGSLSLTGEAAVDNEAGLSETLEELLLSSSESSNNEGTLLQALAPAGLASVGLVPIEGTLSKLLEELTLNSFVAVGSIEGTLEAQLAPIVLSSSPVETQNFESVQDFGLYRIYYGFAGTNDGSVLIETTDVTRFDTFFLSHGAGNCKVEIHDGLQWLTNPLAVNNLGTTQLNPVLQTSPLTLYGWKGRCRKLRVRQVGAVQVTTLVLRIFRS